MALFTARNLLSLLAFSALLAVGDGAQLSMPRNTQTRRLARRQKATLRVLQRQQNDKNPIMAALEDADKTPVLKQAPKSISKPSQKKKNKGKDLGMRKKGSFRSQGSHPKKFQKKEDPVLKYKTTLCRHFENWGDCKLGDACNFAHGDGELRTKEMNKQMKREEAQFENVQKEDQKVQMQKDMFEASGVKPLEGFGPHRWGLNDCFEDLSWNESVHNSPIHGFTGGMQVSPGITGITPESPVSPISPNGDDFVVPQRQALNPKQFKTTAQKTKKSLGEDYWKIATSLPSYALEQIGDASKLEEEMNEELVSGFANEVAFMQGPGFIENPEPEVEDNHSVHDDLSNRANDGSKELSVESGRSNKDMFEMGSHGSFNGF